MVSRNRIVLIKIGGSIITSPGKLRSNEDAMTRIAHELKSFSGRAILVHGTGHVGKPPAITHGYLKTKRLPKQKMRIALQIRSEIDELTTTFSGVLNGLGVPVAAMDNIHFFGLQGSKWNGRHLMEKVDQLTRIGVIPLFAGNFLPLANGSARIFSSDEMMLSLARLLKPDKVIFLTDVDGVLDGKGDLIKRFGSSMLGEISGSPLDVSGGMKKKMATALKMRMYCEKCVIANGTKNNVLKKFLQTGRTRGTYVLRTG